MIKRYKMKLYASYRAENLSIRIKKINSDVWSHSKPSKFGSNMSFKPKLIPKIKKNTKLKKLFYYRPYGGKSTP